MDVQPQRADVLLVGGGVASVRCARTLRRHGFTGSVLIVGDEDHAPYNRPPLSKELLRDDLADELVLAEPERWYGRRAVDLLTGRRVTTIDTDAREAMLDNGGRIAFGQCLLATGAEARALPIEGGAHALLLRTLEDARRLRAAVVAADAGAAVTVIGGGFIGVEVASGLAAVGLRPTIVEMASDLWGGLLGAKLADWGAAHLIDAGVALCRGVAVTRLDEESAWIGDERLPHAFVVAGIGVRPRVELAVDAELEVGDGIVTDADQRTSHPAIWAAGDVARVDGRRVEHWHAARDAGERAARSMLSLPVPPLRVPWVFSEVAGIALDIIGQADTWEEERWMRDASVLAYLDGQQVVQLAIIGSVLSPDTARDLVEAGASVHELEDALQS
ncbi:MAG: FAD-dependent oxidoreductase [Chloroflexi bacterium]|nr:FAD-dependent oxidoreductase [Chloroflexota bacterium]